MSREQSGGLSVTTLLIASGSAAAAALIVPMFWDRGSIVAAAITPVIVALASEGLKRPVEKVQTVGVWRRTPQGTAIRQPGRAYEALDPDEERLEVEPERTDDPFGLREPERRVVFTRRRVTLALVTAALAFTIAAVVVTASELAIFGDSVSRPNRTTFFGGKERTAEATPTPAPGQEATATPAPAETPPPEATPAEPTPEAGREATPAPTPGAPAPGATPPPASTP